MNADSIQQPKTTNRRRSYLINPAFQWKYAIMLGLGVFLTTSIMSCVLYATLHEEARQRFINPAAANIDAGFMILISAFVFSVLTAGTVITLSVITSHRVCGPLFVLQGYFNQIVAGKIPTPRPLRKKDEFKDIFASFVQATERLKADQRQQFNTYDKLLSLARDVNRNEEQACSNALSSVTNELTQLRDELATVLDIERKPAPSDGESNPALNETKQHAHASA